MFQLALSAPLSLYSVLSFQSAHTFVTTQRVWIHNGLLTYPRRAPVVKFCTLYQHVPVLQACVSVGFGSTPQNASLT